jgi:hypothetical protein
MINFNGDVVFIESSGQVRAQSGDLTLRADSTNLRDIIVGSGRSLRPDTDIAIDLGLPYLRWNAAHINSGIFNTIRAPVSGTHINIVGGLIPERDNFYSLGIEDDFRWANIYATNAKFTTLFTESINNSDDITTNVISAGPGVASFTGPLISRNIYPEVDELYAIGTSVFRYSRIHAASGIFNTISAPTSGTFINVGSSLVPERDAIYSLGTSSLRWANIFAVSGTFSARPTVNGSGVMLQGDISTNAATALDISTSYGTDFVLTHGLGTTDWTWSMWRTDVSPPRATIPRDIFPSGLNAVRIQLDSVMDGRLVLTAAGSSGVTSGSVAMFQTEIDFGNTPIQQSGFSIFNASVSSSSILIGGVAYSAPTSKDLDELEMDQLDLKFGEATAGGFTIYATSLSGPVHGKFKINYSLANI